MRCVLFFPVVPNQARGRPLWRSSASDDPVLFGPFSCSVDVAWWADLGEPQHVAAVYMRLEQFERNESHTNGGGDGGGTTGVTVAVTDFDLTNTNCVVPDTSYVVCSVVTSPFTGLARCDVTEVYGRYVFVKARSETELQLCEVEVFAYRECHHTAIAPTDTVTTTIVNRNVYVHAVICSYVSVCVCMFVGVFLHAFVFVCVVSLCLYVS